MEVPRVDFEKLSDNTRGELSAVIRARIEGARSVQRRRFADYGADGKSLTTNADTPSSRIAS